MAEYDNIEQDHGRYNDHPFDVRLDIEEWETAIDLDGTIHPIKMLGYKNSYCHEQNNAAEHGKFKSYKDFVKENIENYLDGYPEIKKSDNPEKPYLFDFSTDEEYQDYDLGDKQDRADEIIHELTRMLSDDIGDDEENEDVLDALTELFSNEIN